MLDKVGDAAFSILMTLFLAHMVWGLTNRYIQHKLEMLAPPPSEEKADVLSGIFYLVDDTFRVGEYIQAGNVTGTVEGFTLRNVNLRHDKGALQIVPFSKLGAVTNFNRGGCREIQTESSLRHQYLADAENH